MAKPSRAIGMIATISFAVSAVLPQPVHAGDDTVLAQKLWAQGRVLSDESEAMTSKMEEAFNQGDFSTACYYVTENQRNSQAQFDLMLRMSNLDLDPQNSAPVQEQLENTRDTLDAINELASIPECNAPVEPVNESTTEQDMQKLNTGVAIGRQMDADGRKSFDGEEWMLACAYLGAAKAVYASNSRSALELSQRFSAEDNPQPHLAELSAELAELENAVTPKRDVACENEKAGG